MNLDEIRSIVLPLAPFAEQEAIVDMVEDQLSIVQHLEADLDAKLEKALALRQAILQHAFSGKLVSQDPNDEPASELLKRIAAERAARAHEATVAQRGPKKINRFRAGRRGQRRNKLIKDH